MGRELLLERSVIKARESRRVATDIKQIAVCPSSLPSTIEIQMVSFTVKKKTKNKTTMSRVYSVV